MSIFDNSKLINDRGDCLGRVSAVHGVVLLAQLAADVTFTGIVDSNGQPTAWVIAGGSAAGAYAAPGAKHTGGGNLWYSLASASDLGKVVIAWAP